ncbi:MAG: type II toxin-antitoxin system HicA family toxin [bacterium]|nr:type II toxin-antitoxin system HicA family toxin [bacterium]
MKPVSGKHLCRVLDKHGWELRRIRGSHRIYAQPGNPIILTVPVHGSKDMKSGTLRQLLKDAGLTEEHL